MKEISKFELRKRELFKQVNVLIQKEGFDSLTVRKICKELGISTGTFYHYFTEKGDIAWILFSDMDWYFDSDVVIKFTDNEINNLIEYSVGYARYVINNGIEAARYISLAPFKNRNNEYFAEDRSVYQVLLKVIERGQYKEQFISSVTSTELARMVLVLLRGYFSDWAKRSGSYDLIFEVDKFIRIFIVSIKNNV